MKKSGFLSTFYQPRIFWLFLAVLSIAGGFIVFYCTAVAPWAFSDSTVYLAAGVNWIEGNGMGFLQADGTFAHLTHYPPGYPVLIGLTTLLLPDPVAAARWINILSFTLLIFLGGVLLHRITRSSWLPVFNAILLLFCPFLLVPFSGVMSEAPAILAGTLALLSLAFFIKEERKWQLVLAGLLSLAALFIRYQQAAVLLTGGVFLLFFGRKTWRTRLKDTALYALIAAGPFVLWYILDGLSAPGGGARILGLNGAPGEITRRFLANTFDSVKFWFPWRTGLLPGVNASIVRGFLVLLFITFLGIASKRTWKRRGQLGVKTAVVSLAIISFLFLVTDLFFLWVAMLFAAPPPDIDNRMLSPLLPLIFILILSLELLASSAFHGRALAPLVMAATVALFCLVFAPQVKTYAVEMHGYGEGYTSLTFKDSSFITRIKTLSARGPIVTNSPALVQFFTLKEPYRTFDNPDDPALTTSSMFGDQATEAQTLFRERCAPLVIFDPDLAYRYNPESALYFPAEAQKLTSGLDEITSDQLGEIYLYPGCSD